MAHCYQVEIDGTLTYLGDDPANCPGYVLITASSFPNVTYWAELAQEFEPGSQQFNDAMGYITAALITAWIIKVLIKRISPKL